MNKIQKFALFVFLISAMVITLLGLVVMYSPSIAVLNPQGIIALKERNLIFISIFLMLIVVIPVFIMTTLFAWRYRASNKRAKYDPNWDHSLLAEAIWWGVPFIIVFILAIITWTSTHELDPFQPLETDKKPLNIQVIALQWKWLFVYPEQNIATVNFLNFPEKTPIVFEITADAPMNSFWIPQLGGQIYAMPGMTTQLHLMADQPGQFQGSSANLSGEGFSRMTFIAEATSESDFDQWVQSVKAAADPFGWEEYNQLAKPSVYHSTAAFALSTQDLFKQILMKYMMPMESK